MVVDDVLQKYGFVRDEDDSYLRDFFKNDSKLRFVHIDIYSENPLSSSELFMLILKTSEKNLITSNDGNRLILRKNDKYKTHITNVLFSEIKEIYHKHEESCTEFVLKIQNTYFRAIIFN